MSEPGAGQSAGLAGRTMTLIATAAVQNLLGGAEATSRSRTPEIVADAAYVVLESL